MRGLNMWQRLGVVVSLLWIVGGGLWQRTSDLEDAAKFSEINYTMCSQVTSMHGDYNFNPCSKKATREYELMLDGSWGNVAAFAFGPVVLGWLLAWISLRVGRWVWAGKENQ